MLPTCQRYGMGVIPWSPLAGGWLTGRYRKGQRPARAHRAPAASRSATTCRCPATSASSTRSTRSRSWPTRPGCRSSHLALAFVLEHPAVTSAIIGPRTMEQLDDLLGARRRHASTTTCSTASTRSSRRGRTSTRRMRAGRTRRCHGAPGGGRPSGGRRTAAAATPCARRSARVTGSVRARTTIGTARATISHMTVAQARRRRPRRPCRRPRSRRRRWRAQGSRPRRGPGGWAGTPGS